MHTFISYCFFKRVTKFINISSASDFFFMNFENVKFIILQTIRKENLYLFEDT